MATLTQTKQADNFYTITVKADIDTDVPYSLHIQRQRLKRITLSY